MKCLIVKELANNTLEKNNLASVCRVNRKQVVINRKHLRDYGINLGEIFQGLQLQQFQ